jgi:hypothetical protein
MLARIRRLRPAGFVAGFVAAVVLTGGGAAAYAANGGSVIIGRANSGTATTTLTNTAGTPLKLNAKSGYAPLAVNSSVKVPYLNADRIDGLDSTSFLRSTARAADSSKLAGLASTSYALAGGRTGIITTDASWEDTDGDGVDDSLIAMAACPAGTQLTGGGVDNFSSGPTLVDSPDAGAWFAGVLADQAGDLPTDVTAYAVCYNPRGAVPGAAANVAQSQATSSSGSAIPSKVTQRMARAAAHQK